MNEVIKSLEEFLQKINQARQWLDLDMKKNRLIELNTLMSEAGFWDNNKKASKISKEAAGLQEEIDVFEKLEKQTRETLETAKELEKENDDSLTEDIKNKLAKLEKEFGKIEFAMIMNEKYDKENAVISIHAGAGGTDAQDWAEMLMRMYMRYAEIKNFQVNIIDKSDGSEAGIKSAELEIKGKYAFGFLKSEAGVHRLVRISPFDAEKMRHTSFAMVEVLPEFEEVEEIELKDEDLEITTAKASGPGGQGVNTTDSAVRIKHKPTGLMTTCKNERSQLQNKETALKILKSKLKKFEEEEQEEERKKLRGEFSEAAWGNQVRSYVLHPYKMVKDHRSNFETQEVEKILDGELEQIVESVLKIKP